MLAPAKKVGIRAAWANDWIVKMKLRQALQCALVTAACVTHVAAAFAGDSAEYTVVLTDTGFSPPELRVPSGTRIKVVLVNASASAVEFESVPLRKEKVLGPHATSFVVFRGLDSGEYLFFDDFHPNLPPAKIIAE